MEDIRQSSILTFDTIFTTNHIRMLKIVLPFCPSGIQKHLAVYIRYLELQYTAQYFPVLSDNKFYSKSFPYPDSPLSSDSNKEYYQYWNAKKEFTPDKVIEELIPYCTPSEKENIIHMQTLFQTMQNIKNIMEMMDTMKELFPEGMNPDINGSQGFPVDFFSFFTNQANGDYSTLFNSFSEFGNINGMSDLFN